MIKKMMLLVLILPFSLSANEIQDVEDVEDALHWAKRGNIEELGRSYLGITDSDKDTDIIPTIRIYGHLEAFYVSLAKNGNIEDLVRLMDMDCLLTKDIRSNVFNTTLTVYKGENHTWNDEEKRDLYADFLSSHVDFVHDTLQSDWRAIFVKQVPKHIFSTTEHAAFDQESAPWEGCSF